MPHDLPLVTTIAAALASAWVLGVLAQRIGLSPIVGYLLAGVVIGPHTPGFVGDVGLASQLAEIGVVLLMFGVGLHFHFKDLLAVKGIAIPGALLQSGVSTLLGLAIGLAFGWTVASGLVLGMALAVASTVVLMRVLEDRGLLATTHGHAAVGWLLVEDVLTVAILVVIPALAGVAGSGPAEASRGLAASLGLAIAQAGRPRGPRRPRRLPGRPPHAGARGAAALARALHPDRPRDRGHGGDRVGAPLRRLDGPRRLPRRHGGRPVAGEPAGRRRRAAAAGRVRRAVLRLGRDAVRSRVPAPRAGARARRPGGGAGREAAGRPGRRRRARIPGADGARRRPRPRAGRRVLLHPRQPGPRARPPAGGRLQRGGGLRHRLDLDQPVPVRLARPARGGDSTETLAVAAARRRAPSAVATG